MSARLERGWGYAGGGLLEGHVASRMFQKFWRTFCGLGASLIDRRTPETRLRPLCSCAHMYTLSDPLAHQFNFLPPHIPALRSIHVPSWCRVATGPFCP